MYCLVSAIKRTLIIFIFSCMAVGCGVKSAPDQPSEALKAPILDGSGPNKKKDLLDITRTNPVKRDRTRSSDPKKYRPPKPATETLIENPLTKGN